MDFEAAFENGDGVVEQYFDKIASFLKSEGHVKDKTAKALLETLNNENIGENSSLHLLVRSKNFKLLHSLDLSDNSIYDLQRILTDLNGLDSLQSVSLEGNPCYVIPLYKNSVLRYLPDILYLDNTEVLVEDRKIIENNEKIDNKPQIYFICYRIMGLPSPPKDKKAIQTIHVEVDLPLIEEAHVDISSENIIEVSEKKSGAKKSASKKLPKKNKSTTEKSSKSSKKSKGKKSSPYGKPDEYDPISEKNNFSFKTARIPWSKVIEFPPIFIESPENDMATISDTFKSCVNVRVVYLKVLPPGSQKKRAKTKTKKDKKKLKSNLSANLKKIESKNVTEEPQEIIAKKVTLCSFYCNLTSVNWSDETVDFYWADHQSISSIALRMEGCLKVLDYTESKGIKAKGKGKLKESMKTKSTNEILSEIKEETVKCQIPKLFTCQVGFGLRRETTEN